ncbi:hypothetical protein GF402_01345 [Candidatus Fermentibacteria bacterium]|nr:hypothetical protein [Candidatus Fermentibacteria bacterium]
MDQVTTQGASQRPQRRDRAMRDVLLVSYHFPPHGGKAVQRASKLAKYLPEFGWRPVVFALPEKQRKVPMDPTLLDELPGGLEVHRPSYFDYRRVLPGEIRKLLPRQFPDRYRPWSEKSAPKLASLVRSSEIQAMVTTSPTHSTQLLGLRVKRATGIPWAADFRDPWSSDLRFGDRPGEEVMRSLETDVLEEADAVVGVFPRILRDFEDRAEPERLYLIENGYDEDDFEAVDWGAPPLEQDVLTLGHNGTVSDNRDPAPVLNALRRLLASESIEPGSIRAVFTTAPAGRKRFAGFEDLLEAGMLEVRGYRPHSPSIAELARLDVSLLLLTQGEAIYPAKLFEYMRLGNPILSVSKPGDDLHELIASHDVGMVVDRSDEPAIAEALLELLESKSSGNLPHLRPDLEGIRRFSRRDIARRYAELLDSISSG